MQAKAVRSKIIITDAIIKDTTVIVGDIIKIALNKAVTDKITVATTEIIRVITEIIKGTIAIAAGIIKIALNKAVTDKIIVVTIEITKVITVTAADIIKIVLNKAAVTTKTDRSRADLTAEGLTITDALNKAGLTEADLTTDAL